jgi:hypothetical protein
MPIWLHLILTIVCTLVGFFGGAIIGAVLAVLLLTGLAEIGVKHFLASFCVEAPLFFGGAVLGLNLAQRFAFRYLPARCPQCGDRTYNQPGRRITYRCDSCGHIHVTNFHQG